MKNITINLNAKDRCALKEVMLDQNEGRAATAVRRALEGYLGFLADVEIPGVVCVRISAALDAEIKRRGLGYSEAVRRALSAYAVDGVE